VNRIDAKLRDLTGTFTTLPWIAAERQSGNKSQGPLAQGNPLYLLLVPANLAASSPPDAFTHP
jgi:hypothetical protein